MNRRVFLSGLLGAVQSRTQKENPVYPWVCPMDPEVRSQNPAKCPKCGMSLVAGIADPREFDVDVQTSSLRIDWPVRMTFRMTDPQTHKPAKLRIMHEKLLHLFLVSGDLSYFAHEHPLLQDDGSFAFTTKLPLAGEYRLLCDFYPENATPQMVAKTLIVPGPVSKHPLEPDSAEQAATNMKVRLRCEPVQPIAGTKTMLFFELDPFEGLEQYLGAWGHMLVASSDLVDMLHVHPAWEDAGPEVQFNVIFPRAGIHRIWVQFQRNGEVNTAAFNVDVLTI